MWLKRILVALLLALGYLTGYSTGVNRGFDLAKCSDKGPLDPCWKEINQ